MELSQLEALLAIADAGTFSAAAERLAITQSALSRRIQTLEAECRDTLLVRSRPRVEPTATGREVLASARRIQAEMDHLHELLAPDSTDVHGRIRAAATSIGVGYIYWNTCEQFLKAHPRVDLVFQDVETPADGPRLVRARAVDVAFTALPVSTGGSGTLQAVPLGNVESVMFAHPDHPLVSEAAVTAEQLRDARVVLYRRRTEDAEFANLSWFDQLGISHQTAPLETGDVEYLKRLVMLERGISVLPWPAIAREIEDGRLARIRLADGGLFQDFGLVHPAGRVSRAVRVLANFCRAQPLSILHAR